MTDTGPTTEPVTARQAPPEDPLVRRIRQGDRGAYGQVVLLYQDRLYNAVVRLIGDREEAADICQEAFCRGLEHVDSFKGDSGLYTWLFKIASNLAISHVRKVKRRRTFTVSDNGSPGHAGAEDQARGLLEQTAGKEPMPDARIQQREQQQQVVEALGRLGDEQRTLLVMRDIEGFDYRQMAEVLELPLGTLKSRLFRARVALREQLRGHGEELEDDADDGDQDGGDSGGDGE